MFRYPLLCQHPGCEHPALYKIAARWSDGLTSELKTYGLTCALHLPASFAHSRQRHQRTRTLSGELLEPPGIYQLAGGRDRDLPRLVELEDQLRHAST